MVLSDWICFMPNWQCTHFTGGMLVYCHIVANGLHGQLLSWCRAQTWRVDGWEIKTLSLLNNDIQNWCYSRPNLVLRTRTDYISVRIKQLAWTFGHGFWALVSQCVIISTHSDDLIHCYVVKPQQQQKTSYVSYLYGSPLSSSPIGRMSFMPDYCMQIRVLNICVGFKTWQSQNNDN